MGSLKTHSLKHGSLFCLGGAFNSPPTKIGLNQHYSTTLFNQYCTVSILCLPPIFPRPKYIVQTDLPFCLHLFTFVVHQGKRARAKVVKESSFIITFITNSVWQARIKETVGKDQSVYQLRCISLVSLQIVAVSIVPDKLTSKCYLHYQLQLRTLHSPTNISRN